MQRKRSLSPTIWEDPSFNKLSRSGRLAFIGIISNADDDGYLRGDYGSLKRLIFGFDDDNDKEWYEELKKYRGLHFYEINEETYVHLVNWERYQKQREDRRLTSLCPKCPLCPSGGGQVSDSCPPKRREEKEREVKEREEKERGLGETPSTPRVREGAGTRQRAFSSPNKSGNAGAGTGMASARKGKPFYWDQQMRHAQGKWWVLPKEGGRWKKFAGKESEIIWK